MTTKKIYTTILLTIILCVCIFSACGKKTPQDVSENEKEAVELNIYAASSMTETLTEIAKLYKKKAPHVELTFTFDSSGTLKTQIEEGGDCDVFISAAQKQMDELDASVDKSLNPDGLDFVLEGSRFDLLENKVALAVPESNPKNIASYQDLKNALNDKEILLAMGGPDVPVGQYTQKIFAYYGLDEKALAKAGCITYGGNVKDVTTYVDELSVDCGIIYSTDAFSAGLKVVDTAAAEMCGQVIYPAAVMKKTKQIEEAKAFLAFLQGQEAGKLFEAVGFSMMN